MTALIELLTNNVDFMMAAGALVTAVAMSIRNRAENERVQNKALERIQEIEEAQSKKIDALSEQKDGLQAELTRQTTETQRLEGLIERGKRREDEMIEHHAKERQELREEIKTVRVDFDRRLDNANRVIREYNREIVTLQGQAGQQASRIEQQGTRIDELTADLAGANETIATLRAEVNRAQAQVELLEKQIGEARAENGALQRKVEKLSEREETWRAELKKVEHDRDHYMAEAKKLKAERDDLTARVKTLEEQRDTLLQQIEEMREQIQHMQAEIKELKAA